MDLTLGMDCLCLGMLAAICAYRGLLSYQRRAARLALAVKNGGGPVSQKVDGGSAATKELIDRTASSILLDMDSGGGSGGGTEVKRKVEGRLATLLEDFSVSYK